MRTTKNIQKQQRGVTALMFVLLFCIAGIAKVFAVNTVAFHGIAKRGTNKAIFSTAEKQSEVSASAGASDNDADDLDFLPLGHLSSGYTKYTIVNANKQIHIYFQGVSCYSNHLYDLYCNWKFDL